jgi:energy-coupling factor transporter ATP-binding protein EcfA2
MLSYAAKLRLPTDVSESERMRRIEEVIQIVELTEKKTTLIKSLSGGQRKRASIAVELLSDPNLFFLDEPASGLDPGTERNLMTTLRSMSAGGKTVIFVTHSTLNLHLCDKIAFMGAGGHLCFYGSLKAALAFFGVSDVVDIYNLITYDPIKWRNMYFSMQKNQAKNVGHSAALNKSPNKNWLKQTFILSKRHLHILMNDRIRLLLILLQAPLLALLIAMVADGNQYMAGGAGLKTTKGLLFALACSAFWIGVLNSIQEVCKERNILKREYMTGQRLDVYVFSKMMVMTIICAVQSFLLVSVFALVVGLPEKSVMMGSYPEFLLTAFLTALSASAMGIFVSSLFKNADRAMSVAPLLLMPQLLFSGMIFDLSGATKVISVFAACRWSMEGFGSTADLNGISGRNEAFYEVATDHMLMLWGILLAMIVVFSVAAVFVLRSINKERK